ncbi:MAG TPA: peptide chain release factor N(5)-glutamine methyltransferase [bacterium]|nr:peptide chain release factor N(5)-glutamine methyltransferase [bacterium]
MLSSFGITNATFESEMILSHLLDVERYMLYINSPPITDDVEKKFFRLISQRCKHVPIAYILKTTYFWGYQFMIEPGVFIPRPETETIIVAATELIANPEAEINILDMCTGCGVLAVVLAKMFPESLIFATDISQKAVNLARKNVEFYNLQDRVSVYRANIINKKINKKFYLIVSNPPYLTREEICNVPEEVKKEPLRALNGGRDGMQVIRRILEIAPELLEKEGFLILEISPWQVKFFHNLEKYGLVLVRVFKDITGNERVVVLKPV